MDRRELATRSQAWPRAIARGLARAGVTPNQVSVASILFAVLAAYAFWRADEMVSFITFIATSEPGVRWRPFSPSIWFLIAAAGIQLRLLCNLLDGLLAVEGGLKTRTGDLYNEIPDRLADILILIGAGTALREFSNGIPLGVAAAILAVLTAYVRVLGGALGLTQDFTGPMAKQHRMFVLTLGAVAAAIEKAVSDNNFSLQIALDIIVLGAAITVVRRIVRIARQLNAR